MGLRFNNYQSLGNEAAGKGAPNRPVPRRIGELHIPGWIDKTSRVLDIGCNRGYFGVCLSRSVRDYVGIDADAKQLKYGAEVVKRQGLENVFLYPKAFEDFSAPWKFDLIMSLAVHAYSRFMMCDYASKIVGMLNPRGVVLVEGHPKGYMGEPAKLNTLIDLFGRYFRLEQIFHTDIVDRGNHREVYAWQKLSS